MRKMAVNIGIVFLTTVNLFAIEGANLKELLSESLRTYNQYEKISDQRKTVTKDISEKISSARSKIIWLKQPVYDEKMITHYNDNIAMYKSWIEQYKGGIETAKITDPDERAKLAEKYDDERKRILAEEGNAARPFQKRIKKLKQEVKDKQKPFEQMMKKYCLSPKSKYPGLASTSVEAPYHVGTLTYRWHDADKKQLGWAWVSLRDKPVIKENAEILDNKFYISKHFSNSIEVWAGYFRVDLHILKMEWFGKEKITKLIKDFVDLDGLAKIDPSRNDSDLNALAMESLACAKKYRIIRKEQSVVTKPLTNERVKVKTWMARLRKPPADNEQLQKDRDTIAHFTDEIKTFQDRLEIGTITDANERTAMITKLEAEKKTLDAEKKKISRPYDDKIRKLTSGLKIKDALLNDAMRVYLLERPHGYDGISEMTTRTRFRNARISCRWKSSDGSDVCFSQIEARDKPAVPENAQMLDGLYYIHDGGGDKDYIWLWVGDLHVYFKVNERDWLEKEKITEILKKFIDLPGLSKIADFQKQQ